jgi:hypothetical protein
MTKKLNPYEMDAYNMITHASQEGVALEEYTDRVCQYARKRVRMMCKGLRKDD